MIALMRADKRRSLLTIAWHLTLAARASSSVMPTWTRLTQDTKLSRSTVARRLADLHDAGLLGTLETGSTLATRGRRAADTGDANRAAVYVLCQPRSPVPRQATQAPELELIKTDTPGVTSVGSTSFAQALRGDRCVEPWSMTATTRTRADELDAASRLQALSLDLHRISPRHVRSLIRGHLRAGWTVADLLHAIDHDPSGDARTWTGQATHPAGWLPARLAAWTGHQPPSVIAGHTQKRLRRAQAAQRLSAGLPAVTQADRDRVHAEARRATLEAQKSQAQSSDPARTASGVARCRAALAQAAQTLRPAPAGSPASPVLEHPGAAACRAALAAPHARPTRPAPAAPVVEHPGVTACRAALAARTRRSA